MTTVIFRLQTNTDRALIDAKDAVTRIRAKLPRNVEEPLIQRVERGWPDLLRTLATLEPIKDCSLRA